MSLQVKATYLFLCVLSFILFYPVSIAFIIFVEYLVVRFGEHVYLLEQILDLLYKIPGSNYALALVLLFWRPLLALIALPFFFVSFLYVSAFWIFMMSRLRSMMSSLGKHFIRHFMSNLWDIHGRIFHGYNVRGLHHVNANMPGLIVYYHGTVPVDVYHFMARYVLDRDSCPIPIVDNFMMRVPGIQNILRLVGATSGTVDECVKMIRDDPTALLMIGPGGVREALFSDEYYTILWGKRSGFARIAIEAQCAIYPMFTVNIREPIRPVQLGMSIWRRIYEYTRMPLRPLYGYFPVKLTTHIGEPLFPMEGESPQQLADRVNAAVADLIRRHQIIPGNILRATKQRFTTD